ncbi:normocyte-binding protein, partial [Paenibacillus sp. 28ISP30-2]|nr:normocyte-binding protein [Paenibacillus sp. 28ISP30-2]
MKELVQDRLSKMDDLEQRRLLKNMMAGVFMNLVEYQEEMTRQLERRVFEEIENTEEKFDE